MGESVVHLALLFPCSTYFGGPKKKKKTSLAIVNYDNDILEA